MVLMDFFLIIPTAIASFALIYFSFEYFMLKKELKSIDSDAENKRLREECERLKAIIRDYERTNN